MKVKNHLCTKEYISIFIKRLRYVSDIAFECERFVAHLTILSDICVYELFSSF